MEVEITRSNEVFFQLCLKVQVNRGVLSQWENHVANLQSLFFQCNCNKTPLHEQLFIYLPYRTMIIKTFFSPQHDFLYKSQRERETLFIPSFVRCSVQLHECSTWLSMIHVSCTDTQESRGKLFITPTSQTSRPTFSAITNEDFVGTERNISNRP